MQVITESPDEVLAFWDKQRAIARSKLPQDRWEATRQAMRRIINDQDLDIRLQAALYGSFANWLFNVIFPVEVRIRSWFRRSRKESK